MAALPRSRASRGPPGPNLAHHAAPPQVAPPQVAALPPIPSIARATRAGPGTSRQPTAGGPTAGGRSPPNPRASRGPPGPDLAHHASPTAGGRSSPIPSIARATRAGPGTSRQPHRRWPLFPDPEHREGHPGRTWHITPAPPQVAALPRSRASRGPPGPNLAHHAAPPQVAALPRIPRHREGHPGRTWHITPAPPQVAALPRSRASRGPPGPNLAHHASPTAGGPTAGGHRGWPLSPDPEHREGHPGRTWHITPPHRRWPHRRWPPRVGWVLP